MITETLLAASAYSVFVFLKAFQQRNVAFLHYRWIMHISYAMSLTDVAVIAIVAHKTATAGLTPDLIWFGLAIGTGGGLGAIVSMHVHERYLTK
jgi:hypothetical protein